MATLTYRCPHCNASHEIEEALIGERIDCRKCGRPFEASMPIARPVEAGDQTASTPNYQVKAGEGEVEDQILQLHPSMLRSHPFRFLGLCLLVLAGIAALFFGLVGGVALPGNAPPLVLLVSGAILAGVAGIYLVSWWLEAKYTTLTVTNRRTELRRGLISRNTSEVRHEDVRNLQVHQTTVERLLGVGDIAISSAGQDDLEIHVHGITNPEKIASIIRDMQ